MKTSIIKTCSFFALVSALHSCAELGSNLKQGSGDQADEGDLDVAEPVPMWLVAEDKTLSRHEEKLNKTGAHGETSGSHDTVLNPMNTARWNDPTNDEKKQVLTCSSEDQQKYHELTADAINTDSETAILPVNFDISLKLISLPGLAAGELLATLKIQSKLLEVLNEVGSGRTFTTKHSVTKFDLNAETEIGGYRFVEIVVVAPADKDAGLAGFYRINYYLRTGEDSYELATYIEFSPHNSDQNYADIHLVHQYQAEGESSFKHLELDFDTKSQVVKAVFGTSPDLVKGPTETHLELRLLDNMYAIFGATRYSNSGTSLSNSTGSPRHYSPLEGDVLYFRALQDLTGSKKSVQDLTLVPLGVEPPNDEASWKARNDQIPNLVLDYLVGLLRGGSNGACATEMDYIRSHPDFSGKSIPAALAEAPANICSSNSNITDSSVKSWILSACGEIRYNKCFNIKVGDVQQSAIVGVCRKVAEALLLKNNHQRILVEKNSDDSNVRLLNFAYGNDSELVKTLVGEPTEDAEYAALETFLEGQTVPTFTNPSKFIPFSSESKNTNYFSLSKKTSGVNPIYLTSP